MSGQGEQRRHASSSPSLGDGVFAGALYGAIGAALTWVFSGGNALASVLVSVTVAALVLTMYALNRRQLWLEGDSVHDKSRQRHQAIALSDIRLIWVNAVPKVGWRLNIEGAAVGEAICNVAIDSGTQEFRRELGRRLDEVGNANVFENERAARALRA
jgi:hypothetical protein